MSGPVKYHFVIALLWPDGATQAQYGFLDIRPGNTRSEVLEYLIGQMRNGRSDDPLVTSFSLEPNDILGGAL